MEPFNPSPLRAYLYALGAMVVALAAEGALLPAVQIAPDFLLFAATAAVALLFCAYAAVQCSTTTYTISGDSLIMRRGLISTVEKTIPIKNIDNIEVKISLFGRLLGLADVYVDTPGGYGYELVMKDVPQLSADVLVDQVEKLKQGA